jgi:hypothetical protein
MTVAPRSCSPHIHIENRYFRKLDYALLTAERLCARTLYVCAGSTRNRDALVKAHNRIMDSFQVVSEESTKASGRLLCVIRGVLSTPDALHRYLQAASSR